MYFALGHPCITLVASENHRIAPYAVAEVPRTHNAAHGHSLAHGRNPPDAAQVESLEVTRVRHLHFNV